MITAGCDVGSLTAKAVVMKDGRVAGSAVIKSGRKPWESAENVFEQALALSGISRHGVEFIIGTGYGREKISFVNETASELACHGKGAKWAMPSVRTVIDIGGQDCKAIRVDHKGDLEKFITNDKCASGTGRFLEVMAKVLGIGLEELGPLSQRSGSPIKFASTCTVWAQADVIQHLNNNVPIEDIAAGVNNAMAARMSILLNSIGLNNDICMTGGVAKNAGVISSLEKMAGTRIKRIRKVDPQVIGALGAAVLAMEKMKGGVK